MDDIDSRMQRGIVALQSDSKAKAGYDQRDQCKVDARRHRGLTAEYAEHLWLRTLTACFIMTSRSRGEILEKEQSSRLRIACLVNLSCTIS